MKKNPLLQIDPLLKPYTNVLEQRQQRAVLKELEFTDGKQPLKDCVNNHLYYGLHDYGSHWIFREKAPYARRIFIYGDFSAWQLEEQYALQSLGNGDWEIRLPKELLRHGMLYKLWMMWDGGNDERIPAYCRRVVQDQDTKVFSAQVWQPDTPFTWQYFLPQRHDFHYIYEAHIGMSSEKPEVSSYIAFKDNVLPRIHKLGYNTIQLMAIQEHPYYGSFGYQVANYFAPSFRFGTPEELKALIDEAHRLDIAVILDIVHSHTVSNAKEGIGQFDGSEHLYCHQGSKGKHPVWNSRCFNYGKQETLAFLLSNVKYWLTEFRFDGLRFDGVTSMCYWDHGIGVDFVNYAQYFNNNVDEDAVTYLTLANRLAYEINPEIITIAEDVSGMPGLAFPIAEGGVGFDYRMSMGVADFWKETIKSCQDEQWHVGDIFFRLTDKRKEEKTISYAESHDQAMVGDKTIIFQLIDKEIYFSMAKSTPSLLVDRGMAIHKLIRLLTLSLSNGGYLNFMGNEFGHPEWIDFPRGGNNWSYAHALRRWDLADDPNLKYHLLQAFDQALIHCIQEHQILHNNPIVYAQHIENQVLFYERNGCFFAINLSPTHSYTDYALPCLSGEYELLLNTDSKEFGGFGNIDESVTYFTHNTPNGTFIKLYLPARSGIVLKKK